ARDVEPPVRLRPWRLAVGAVEGDPLAPALAAAGERVHGLVAQLLGQAPEARELGAGDRQEAPALLGNDLVRARDVGFTLALLVRKRAHAGVCVHDLVQSDARVGQDLAHLAQEIRDLVAGRGRGAQSAAAADLNARVPGRWADGRFSRQSRSGTIRRSSK